MDYVIVGYKNVTDGLYRRHVYVFAKRGVVN